MKRLHFISLLLALVIGLSGVGSIPALASAPGADQVHETVVKEADAKVTFWVFGAEWEQVLKILDNDWNPNHPDFQIYGIHIVGSADECFQKLSAAFAGGSGPDIFSMSATDIVKYVESGIAMDLDKWFRPNIDDYYPPSVEAVTFDGKIYATPSNMDLLALFYNKDMLEEAGLEPPTTWAETIETAKALTTDTQYGLAITTLENGYQNFEFYPFVWMNGGDVMSPDRKTVTVNSEATLKAYGFYRDLINSGAVNRSVSENEAAMSFLMGGSAMVFSGSFVIPYIMALVPDLNYGIAPFPVPEAGMASVSDAGGWRYMVSTRGNYAEECGEFLNWLTNGDVKYQVQICEACIKFSPRKSVRDAMPEYYQQFPYNYFSEEILPLAGMEPAFPAAVVKAFGEGLQKAMFTNEPLEDIVAEVEEKCLKGIE